MLSNSLKNIIFPPSPIFHFFRRRIISYEGDVRRLFKYWKGVGNIGIIASHFGGSTQSGFCYFGVGIGFPECMEPGQRLSPSDANRV